MVTKSYITSTTSSMSILRSELKQIYKLIALNVGASWYQGKSWNQVWVPHINKGGVTRSKFERSDDVQTTGPLVVEARPLVKRSKRCRKRYHRSTRSRYWRVNHTRVELDDYERESRDEALVRKLQGMLDRAVAQSRPPIVFIKSSTDITPLTPGVSYLEGRPNIDPAHQAASEKAFSGFEPFLENVRYADKDLRPVDSGGFDSGASRCKLCFPSFNRGDLICTCGESVARGLSQAVVLATIDSTENDWYPLASCSGIHPPMVLPTFDGNLFKRSKIYHWTHFKDDEERRSYGFDTIAEAPEIGRAHV